MEGLATFGALAALYHPLTTYGEDLGLDTDDTVSPDDGGFFTSPQDFALVYGDIADRSPLVSDAFYQLGNEGVRAAGVDAELHYETFGWREGRDPNAYFSTLGYRAANADALSSDENLLTQYHAEGWREGRDPGARFDVEFYLARNPDVAAAGIDPLAHYLNHGRYEGREIHAAIGEGHAIAGAGGFDAEYYLLSNPAFAAFALGSATRKPWRSPITAAMAGARGATRTCSSTRAHISTATRTSGQRASTRSRIIGRSAGRRAATPRTISTRTPILSATRTWPSRA